MNEFIEYLQNDQKKSDNTIMAYAKDVRAFAEFLEKRNDNALDDCQYSDAIAYLMELDREHKSKQTINRKASALRAYYNYEIKCGRRQDNPFDKLRSTRVEKREVQYLTEEEVAELLGLPGDSLGEIRDKALMEFIYATGARVTEVVRLKFEDINLRMNFATLRDSNAENRIVPIGGYAADALNVYLRDVYSHFAGHNPQPADYVFINQRGQCLTRQGIWKILQKYGEQLELKDRITASILRDSFAVHILQNGGDIKTLQDLMGFEDAAVASAYLAVTDIKIKDVYTRCHPRAIKR